MADIKDDDLPEIDLAKTDGYVVDGTDEDDPSLIMPDGSRFRLGVKITPMMSV